MLLMFTDPVDLQRMCECQQVYKDQLRQAFGTSVWPMADGPPSGGAQWSTTHLLYLGAHLSPAEETWPVTWHELETKVTTCLACWTGLIRVLSYRAGVLVINQLVAATLWLVGLFWDKREHWVNAAVLSPLLEEGDQALVCLRTQVATFYLQTLQRYLYIDPPPKWCALVTISSVRGLLLKFWLHFNPMPLICGNLVQSGVDKSMDLLVALLLGLAKMAIN
eukprot:g31850.t1